MSKYWWEEDDQQAKDQQKTEKEEEKSSGYWWEDGNIANTAGTNITNRVNSWLKNHSSYVSDYQNRYSGRKGNYEDAYVSDSQSWLNKVSQQKSSFDAEADSILAYMDQYSDYLDAKWVEDVRNTITGARADQKSIYDSAVTDNQWWNSFNDKDLVAQYGSAEEVYKYFQRGDRYNKKYAGMSLDELNTALDALAEGEEKDWLAYNLTPLAKGTLSENADWEERSQYKTTYRGGEKFNAFSGMYTDTGYDDITYDYINRDEKARGRMLVNDIASNASFAGVDSSYLKEMTDDEIAVYNYLYDPNDTTAADKYLSTLLSDLNYRQRQTQQKYWSAYAKEHPVLSSGFSILTSPLKGLSAIGQVADYAADGAVDQNAAYNKFSYIPSTIREQVSSDIATPQNGVWGEIGSWTYQLGMGMGDFLVNSALSGGSSALSLALMGSGAMADTVISAKDRGLSDDQAMILGVVAGAAEIVTEKFSLDALFKGDMTRGAMRYILTNALTEGTEEVGSSVINLLADVLVSKDKSEWQMQVQEYLDKNPGATEQQAFWKVLGDTTLSLGLDFVGGALMGGVMGSAGAVTNYLTDGRPGIKENQDAVKKYGENTDALIQEGLGNDKKSDSYYLANKYQKQVQGKNGKGGKALTGAQIRNLLAANQEQVTAKDMKMIQQAAETRLGKLGQKNNLSKIAELATKYVTGGKLTRAERSFLVNSEYGPQLTSEMLGNKKAPDNLLSRWENDMSEGTADNFSTEWAENIGTKSVNRETFDKKAYEAETEELVRSIVEQLQTDPNAYKSLESRMEGETDVAVSDTGKAVVHGTDQEVDLSAPTFKEITEDGVVLEANGTTVSSKDIDYDTEEQGLAINAIGKIEHITPETASALYAKLDMTKPVMGQLNGMDEAFTYGYYNYSEADLAAGNFAENLTKEQQNDAYKLGQYVAKQSTTAKTEAIKQMRTAVEAATQQAIADGKDAPKSKKMTITYNAGSGNVVDFDKSGLKLSNKQKAAPVFAQALHEMGLGTNFEFFSSYVSKSMKDKDGNAIRVRINENGEEVAAPSGIYKKSDGTVCIDLNAYNGRKLTLYSMSHELTHFIQQWSAEKYFELADFLVKTYEKTDMSMHQRVLREQKRLENIRGEEISYDEAYDEVVANAMGMMLADSNVMEKIAELQTKDMDLAKKLWEGLKKILHKFFRAYENKEAIFHDAADILDLKPEFEQLQRMWAEAFVEASENFQANLMATEVGVEPVAVEDVTQFSYSSLAEAAGFEAVQNEDGTRSFVRDGKAVSKVTVEDIDNSPIGAFINFSVEMKDITAADAKRQKEMFAQICTMACKTNDFAMTMQFVGSAVFTGMKANADKQYGTTYDFPSICTKTQAVIDAMSAKMMKLGRGLKTDEIVKLYEDVFASGNPVPCPECYVFSRWIGIGGLLDNIKKYQDYYGDMAVEDVAAEYRKMRAEVAAFAEEQGISFGKAKGALTSKITKEHKKLTEKIQTAENQGEKVKPADRKRLAELEPIMNTVKGMTWLEKVYFADSSLKKVNPKFRVPNEVLFDLNNGEAFASQYKEAWAFRTTQGAGYGKAITPYAEARLGEGVLVTNNTTNAIKGRAQGTLNNYFLNQKGKLDKQSRDALIRARLKQKIQAFIGGQRFQSTSDARYENASDYLLAALEMQAMGGMVQAYTKVDGAIPAFSAWGFSSNQSLMPLNGGLDADGNVKDTAVGGMKPEVAFENRNKHESAGTITIGVNDNHIRAMFQQWVRDFIIPYHASGGKADVVAEFRRIQEGKEAKGKAVRSTDYSRTQSDKILSDDVLRWQGKTDAQIQRIHEIRNARIAILTGGKPNMTVVRSNRFLSALYDKLNGGEWDGVKLAKSKVESQIFPNEFWDQSVTYDESAKITKDYLEYCEDLGFLHRFSGMIPSNGMLIPAKGYNEKGERVQLTDLAYKYDENGNKTAEVEPFFWKVLTDRRMYDNSRNYLPQKVVTLNDTTADTVTGFAKNNQGRQYDKAKAEALAKKIAGEQYSSQETDFDQDFDYSQLNWATDLGIITAKDRAIFERTINNEIYRGVKPRTANGEYIIDTGKCLMFTDGDFHNPTLTRVVEFETEYESVTDYAKRRICDEAEATGDIQKSLSAIKSIFGEVFVSSYTRPDGQAYARQNRGRKGSNRSGTAQPARAKSLKERFAEEGLSHLLEDDGEVYSSQQTDLDYMDAVERGDMKTVQKMVDKAAKRAGFPEKLYHGTQKFGYTKIDPNKAADGISFFATDSLEVAQTYSKDEGPMNISLAQELGLTAGNYQLYANTDGFFEVDANGSRWTSIHLDDSKLDDLGDRMGTDNPYFLNYVVDTNELAKIAKQAGYPGVKVTNVFDSALFQHKQTKPATVYIFLDPQSQVKSADPVTYDDNGDVIPLSERFNKKNDDIRYSSQQTDLDSSGKQLGEDQLEYFEKSMVRDRSGRLQVVYHGGTVEYEFDTTRGGKGATQYGPGAYFTDAEFYAKQYTWARGGVVKNYYLNIEKMFDDTDMESTSKMPEWKKLEQILRKNGIEEKFIKRFAEDGFAYMSRYLNLKSGAKTSDSWGGSEQLNTMLREAGFDGIKGYLNDAYQYTIFTPNQAKLTTNEVPSTFYDTRYSTQETDNISNRDLLANAFEGITNGSEEYKLIQKYKSYTAELNSLENKLSEFNRQIREIRFGKGKYDAERLRKIESEAKKIADAINKYDQYLLSLEASAPLRKVIERERKKEAQKTREHVNEILQNKKLRAEQTELRHKIRKVVRDLDKILNRGNKKQNVKEDMQSVVSTALKAADILFTDNYGNYDMLRDGIKTDLSDDEEALVKTCAQMLKDLDKMPAEGYDNWQARQEAEKRLSAKMSKLKDVFARELKRINNTTVSTILGELADAYASLENSEQSYVQGAYSEPVHAFLKNLQNEVGGTIVKDMTKDQLESVYAAYKMVLNTVRNANKMFNEELKQSREQLGNAVIEEVLKAGGVHLLGTKMGDAISQFDWNNMKPIWVANRIGSETFGKLMNGLFKGQYDFAVDVDEVKKFKLSMDEKYHPRNWDAEKLYDFESSTGKQFSLNLQQIMSLYAFSKREQAYSHLLNGGFAFEKNSTVIVDENGKKKTYIHKGATSYKLNDATLNSIINSLSAEQKAFVDEMQKYLSDVMGAKGNEVSMKLYGINMFNEQYYFPLRSSGDFMEKAKAKEMQKEQGQINLVNSGFTHAVKPEAKNPIILSGFMDVWAEHCNEMSMYHSMVLPMEDFRKVYNYSTVHDDKFDSASVQQTIIDAYGDAATKYIDQLYKELNAGATVDPRETPWKKLISNFKKSAVMLSGSVVVQQFSSIGRAFAIIDPKYFTGTKVNSGTQLSAVEEMKKYAPVAIIKEMGGFDTGTKGSAKSYIMAEEYHGVKDKAKGFFTDEQYRGDIMGYLPAKADEKTWCAIWEAVKRETKANHSGMDVKSDEFLKLAGERFSEVIEKTQVYDSVLARSANMRSKGNFMAMATAFMAEPTTTVNLLEDAVRTGNKKYMARAFGAVAVSILLNNALASIVYAMRDDDEDETFIEKYFQAFTSGMIDDINPMTYYPFLKDIYSMFQGYDVERTDMSVIGDVRDAIKQVLNYLRKDTSEMDDDDLAKHNKNLWGAFGSLLDACCSMFGVPLKNVRRDAMGIINAWNTISKDVSGKRSTTWLSFWDNVGAAVKDTIPVYALVANDKAKVNKLYDAIVSGDKNYVARLKSTYVDKKGNFDQSKYNSAVRKALRENDPRIHAAAKARYNGNIAECKRIYNEIKNDGKFNANDILEAINSEEAKIRNGEKTETVSSSYSSTDFVNSLILGDTATARAMKDDIISAKVANGKTWEEAEEAFAESVSTSTKNAYDSRLLDEAGAKNILREYTDMDEDDISSRLRYWSMARSYPQYRDDLNEARVDKYYEFAEPAGISLDVFMQYINGTKGLKTKYDKWGKVEETERDQVLAVIDSLPITWKQKDALYLAHGYAESKIWDVPW